jgi:hypothetical protein
VATPEQARKDIYGAVKTAWDAGASTTGKVLIFDNVTDDIPADEVASTGDPALWGAVKVESGASRQASLRGDGGLRRFRRVGVLFVELYIPAGNGLSLADEASKVVLDAIEGQTTANGVYFRNAQIREEGVSGPWFLTVVAVEFEYDEVK